MKGKNDQDYLFVSIIIPAKNEEKRIGACIDSIFACDYSPSLFEVIVIDNCSSDMTVEIVKNKGAKVFISAASTIAELRNIGVKHAKGEIVGFIDADCVASKSWIKSAMDILEDKNVVACGSLPIVEDNATWVQKTWEFSYTKREEKAIVNWLSSMNLFVKKNAFLSVNGFDESLSTCEDVDICYRLNRLGHIIADKRIRVVHLGEPKTLKDFYRRELWHGQSSFKGALKHGLVLNEIPSLIVPFYMLFIFLIFVISIFQYKLLSIFFFMGLLCLPSFLLALSKCIKGNKFRYFFKLIVLYMIYFIARALALIINFNKRG